MRLYWITIWVIITGLMLISIAIADYVQAEGERRERQDRQERRESWSGKDMHPRERQERINRTPQEEYTKKAEEKTDVTPPVVTPGGGPSVFTDPTGSPVIYDTPEEGKDKG